MVRYCALPIRREREAPNITELALATDLPSLGWTADLDAAFAPFERAGFRAGRVAIDFGVALRVLTAVGEEQAVLAPDLYRQARPGGRPAGGGLGGPGRGAGGGRGFQG